MEPLTISLAGESGRHTGSIGERVLALLPEQEAVQPRPRWFMLRFSLGLVSLFCVSTGVLLTTWALAPALIGWSPSAIVSGSMAPAIERGDLVVFRPPPAEVVGVGGVIRFETGSGGPVVHRVVDVDMMSETYMTRGDANPAEDSAPVGFDDVVGEGVILIPLLGFPGVWAEDRAFVKLAVLAVAFASVMLLAVEVMRMEAGENADETYFVGALTAWSLSPRYATSVDLMEMPVVRHRQNTLG